MVAELLQSQFSTEEIAQKLLGRLLVHEKDGVRTSGFIVETEAYLGIPDLAAHSYGGRRTKRNDAMFHAAGTIYVYVMHTHKLLNIITQVEGKPEGILIRAVEPYEGVNLMETRRGKHGFHLTNGPGNLTKALGITMACSGDNVFESNIYIDSTIKRIPANILATPRIGIPNKGIWTEKQLRYIVSGNPYVSRKKGKMDPAYGWRKMGGTIDEKKYD